MELLFRATKSPSKCILNYFAQDASHSVVIADWISRPAEILASPQGTTLKQKAWAEAIGEAKRIDPNFQQPTL